MAGRATAGLPFSAPAAGFDQPFEMLDACHDRVRRSLSLLLRLGRHLAKRAAADPRAVDGRVLDPGTVDRRSIVPQPIDRQSIDAAADVVRYFDIAAPLHHEDEERHLLPLLRADPDPAQVRLAGRLASDHVRLHAAWQAVRADLQRIRAGQWPEPDLLAARRRWRALAAAYRAHLRLEDGLAYPAVRPRLPADGLRAMGEEMARRRGVRSDVRG